MVLFCFFVHFALTANYFLFSVSSDSSMAFVSLVQAVTLMGFPLLGWLADACCSRYRFVRFSIILSATSSLLILGYELVLLFLSYFHVYIGIDPVPLYITVVVVILMVSAIVSLGMFEATAIQFGMDQMVEASSDQISAFIHWYYWSMNIGVGVMALVGSGVISLVGQCMIEIPSEEVNFNAIVLMFLYLLLPALLPLFLCSVCALVCLYLCKKHLTIEPAGHSPFVKVYKVLKYAWQHKCPERRSAFTYWEEDIPPRIDLGKSKYGGPFTTEEVEDVKTFLLLLILILALFGFHLADDGYSIRRQLHYKLCPSVSTVIASTVGPNIFSSLTVLVGVPLFQFVLPYLRHYVPNMLHRLGIGVVIILFQELAGIVIMLTFYEDYGTCACMRESKLAVMDRDPIHKCVVLKPIFLIQNNCTKLIMNSHDYCGEGDDLFLSLLAVTAVYMMAYHLVFLTALEFISAQAPLKMKGLLISFWYALSAQRYLVRGITTMFISDDKAWFAVHGVKAFLILLSVLVYCCVAKRYRYRLRTEVVNEQYLVEEIYDRELRCAEQHQRENRDEMRFINEHLTQARLKYEATVGSLSELHLH